MSGSDNSVYDIYKQRASFEKSGLLIACEGLDGSGKTTVMNKFGQLLEKNGCSFVLSNWNDTTEIYNLMMSLNASGDINGEMRCLFGAVELAARYHYIFLPALQNGKTVLATKYIISAIAHSVIRNQDIKFVSRLYQFALEPDLTIYIDICPEEAATRKLKTGRIGFWESGLDLAVNAPLDDVLHRYRSGQIEQDFLVKSFIRFQSQLRSIHKQFLQGRKVIYIDGALPLETIVQKISEAVQLEYTTAYNLTKRFFAN